MSWIKTLWLWKELALCLLLGLSLVWGHMWRIAGVLVPAAWDSRRCPLLIKFLAACFIQGTAAWTRCHSLWLAVPVPTGEPGPAGPEGQGLFKGQDTKTCDPRALALTSALHQPLPSCSALSKWHTVQISLFYSPPPLLPYNPDLLSLIYVAASRCSTFSRTPMAGHGTSVLREAHTHSHTRCFFLPLCCGSSLTRCSQI